MRECVVGASVTIPQETAHALSSVQVAGNAAEMMAADRSVLGFDVGTRRIGVAVGTRISRARAVAVVDVHGDSVDWAVIDRLRRDWVPDGLVVGDPLTLDGGDQPVRRWAQAFAQRLRARYRLPVWMMDERSSSIEAARRFAAGRAIGQRRRRDAAHLDAMAAVVIVERWLDAPADARTLTPA